MMDVTFTLENVLYCFKICKFWNIMSVYAKYGLFELLSSELLFLSE